MLAAKIGHLQWQLKKVPRTVQSCLPFLKEPKDCLSGWYHRTAGRPRDREFAAITFLRKVLHGTYVDIGAHDGQSIESIKLFAPDARIVSFEPNPDLACRLARRFRADPNVTIAPIGLSDSVAVLQLHVPVYRGFVHDGLASLSYDDAKNGISSETVYFFSPEHLSVRSHQCRVETLDMQNIDDPVFIKIDVEGFETKVVKGGLETLCQHEPVLLVESLHTKPDLQQLAGSIGYRAYQFLGGRFVHGVRSVTRSSFLITDWRMTQLVGF